MSSKVYTEAEKEGEDGNRKVQSEKTKSNIITKDNMAELQNTIMRCNLDTSDDVILDLINTVNCSSGDCAFVNNRMKGWIRHLNKCLDKTQMKSLRRTLYEERELVRDYLRRINSYKQEVWSRERIMRRLSSNQVEVTDWREWILENDDTTDGLSWLQDHHVLDGSFNLNDLVKSHHRGNISGINILIESTERRVSDIRENIKETLALIEKLEERMDNAKKNSLH